MATALSAQEWLDALVRAREIALSVQTTHNNYSNDALSLSTSALSSHASTIDQATDLSPQAANHAHPSRGMLHKQNSGEGEAFKGRKRFSKRQSKSGLTAVF